MKTTAGIKVSVETFYQANQSHPFASHYFFAYRITIDNASDYTVKLKNAFRHFDISINSVELNSVELNSMQRIGIFLIQAE